VEVAPGSHTVSFSHVEGYTEPAPVTVTVSAGETSTVADTFTRRGSLRVITSPAVAGTISVDGTPRGEPLSTCVETPFRLDVIRPLAPPLSMEPG
jgi:hypothetical protein